MRRTVSLVLAVSTAALAALILGEYELSGVIPAVAGLIVGLLVAEVVVSVGAWRGRVPAAAAAVLAALSLLWAGWIDADGGVEPYPALVWVGAAIAAVTAGLRAGPVSPDGRTGR